MTTVTRVQNDEHKQRELDNYSEDDSKKLFNQYYEELRKKEIERDQDIGTHFSKPEDSDDEKKEIRMSVNIEDYASDDSKK